MSVLNETIAIRGSSSVFGSFAERFFDGLVRIAEASGRSEQIKYLHSLSDQELADRDMTRDDITHHVFRDVYYL